jgi:hypothetical protein
MNFRSLTGRNAMNNVLSAAAKAQIADQLADILEAESRVEGASRRIDQYAAMFRELSTRILAQLGRTATWREARGTIKGRILRWDELMDYWLDKLYHDLDADAGLVITDPQKARRAAEILELLFPVYTLAVLVGLRPDRETAEVEKLFTTANTPAVRQGLEELGHWPMIGQLATVMAEQKKALADRKQQVRPEKPAGTATEVAAEFDELWRRYTGFLADAFDPKDADQAATADRLRAPYDAAMAKLAALRQAAVTRKARSAEIAAAELTAAKPA